MKNSNDTIGNRNRDLTACSAVSQPTAPPRAFSYTMGTGYNPGVKRPRRGVDHQTHLAPTLKKQQSYEGRLLSNAHSEISRKRDHVFKQTKVGSKVQYFSYKLT